MTTAEKKNESLPPLRPLLPWYKEIPITIIAVLNVPMYMMAWCMWIYLALLYFSPNVWIRTCLLLYVPYIFLDRTPSKGARPSGRRNMWISLKMYKWFAQYFDMTLHKTHDLDPSKHYLLLYHPHGIIGLGANIALNSNGCHFDKLFPGVERTGVTLNESFWTPLCREWMLELGYISANYSTLRDALKVQSVILMPGGSTEALYARPGVMKLYLKARKGFIRLALETKCPLVPCIGFGENDIFDTVEATGWLAGLQQAWSQIFRVSMPFMKHIIPRRARVTVVVGEPLVFDENETDVEKGRDLYIKHVKKLYEAEKSKYGYHNIELEIV